MEFQINPYWFKLKDEERRNVVKCLREELNMSLVEIAKAAGVDPSTVHAWLAGKAAPLPDKLERLYSSLHDAMERCLPEPPLTQIDIDRAIAVIARAASSKTWRDYILDKLAAVFPAGMRREVSYRVEREDLEAFRVMALADGISSEAVNKYLRNLSRYFNAVGWTLSAETISKLYTLGFSNEVLRTTAVALKRFIDTVVRSKDPQLATLLYSLFSVPKVSNKRKIERLPTLEEVRKVWEEAAKTSPCAAAVWGIMAETGVRFDQLLKVSIHGLDLERRRIILGETAGVKRQPLIFLTEGAVKYLRDIYLPWREDHLRKTPGNPEKLFPCKEHTIYGALKEARERAGLPWLEPALLRKFVAQWLLDRGVDVTDIAMLQGRALPGGVGVTIEHYIYNYEKRLRDVFDKHAPRVFP